MADVLFLIWFFIVCGLIVWFCTWATIKNIKAIFKKGDKKNVLCDNGKPGDTSKKSKGITKEI
jgi:hypothetical protein